MIDPVNAMSEPFTNASTVAGEIVLVTWRDAYFDIDPAVAPDRDDYLVRTLGFVVESDDARFLVLGQEQLPDDDGYRAVTHIPWAIVVTVTPLGQGGGKVE